MAVAEWARKRRSAARGLGASWQPLNRRTPSVKGARTEITVLAHTLALIHSRVYMTVKNIGAYRKCDVKASVRMKNVSKNTQISEIFTSMA